MLSKKTRNLFDAYDQSATRLDWVVDQCSLQEAEEAKQDYEDAKDALTRRLKYLEKELKNAREKNRAAEATIDRQRLRLDSMCERCQSRLSRRP